MENLLQIRRITHTCNKSIELARQIIHSRSQFRTVVRYGTMIPKLVILPFILFFFDFIFIFIAFHNVQEENHFSRAGKDGCISVHENITQINKPKIGNLKKQKMTEVDMLVYLLVVGFMICTCNVFTFYYFPKRFLRFLCLFSIMF